MYAWFRDVCRRPKRGLNCSLVPILCQAIFQVYVHDENDLIWSLNTPLMAFTQVDFIILALSCSSSLQWCNMSVMVSRITGNPTRVKLTVDSSTLLALCGVIPGNGIFPSQRANNARSVFTPCRQNISEESRGHGRVFVISVTGVHDQYYTIIFEINFGFDVR